MDRAVAVLRRRVDRVELEVALAGVHDVVPHARRHDDRPVVRDVVRLLDRVLGPAELDATASRFDPEELVEERMGLATEFQADPAVEVSCACSPV